MLRLANSVGVYLAPMDDRYPSTEEQQAVHLDFEYPDAQAMLNRWLPLVKWFLATPLHGAPGPLPRGVVFCDCGVVRDPVHRRYPRGIFDFIEGVIRRYNRVVGYAFILFTGEYPPSRLV